VGAGRRDYRRRTYDCLLYHATRGQVPAALWVIFGEDRFRWSATMIGLSLAVFGILHALAQAFRHWSRHQTFRREAGHYRRHGGRRAGLRLAGVRDARAGWPSHYDSSLPAASGMPALQATVQAGR